MGRFVHTDRFGAFRDPGAHQEGLRHGQRETKDPRAGFLTAARTADLDRDNNRSASVAETATAMAAWLNGVPSAAARALLSQADAPTLYEAVLRLARKRFSNIILMPLHVDYHKPLPQFDVDSAIAAEFRTWLWWAFHVDVSFLGIRSPRKGLDATSSFAEEQLANFDSWTAP
ncbi:polyketide synthase [Apiospora hydei]|uniref:Polyketide synthase n=1 Tax=Apiospora hydei TaxID=1337664 RepID=A0ABR1V6V0_9PEZI